MKTAMILAAGRGERLKPLTNNIPKALCPLLGKPLIVYHLEHLAQAGFEYIVINHAYLGGKIKACLGKGQHWGLQIEYAAEPPGGLETAGGIINALPLLGDEPFLTVNADIYTDFPFKTLRLPTSSLAHLVLIPQGQDFGLDENHRLIASACEYTVSGITCYDPSFFKDCDFGRSRLAPLWRSSLDSGKITGEIYKGRWFDIGSVERLKFVQGL